MAYRLYNGCPDDELAAAWRADDKARASLKARARELFGADATALAVYFPMEGKYLGFAQIRGKYYELTDFCDNIISCCARAVERLETLETK